MKDEEAKEVSPIRAVQSSQKSNNSPNRNSILVEDGKKHNAFFRPQTKSNSGLKGAAGGRINNSP